MWNPATGLPYDANASMCYRRLRVHVDHTRVVSPSCHIPFCTRCFAGLIFAQARSPRAGTTSTELVLGTALWGLRDLVASADVGALSICNSDVQFQKSMHDLFVCDISIPLLVLMYRLLTFHVRDQSTFYGGLLMDSILHHLAGPSVLTQLQ